ncbi:MAG: ABC transporter ATP-binding protein/permease [Alphaproteobacteria bacterium]|nr:ABC transporter ATP-binding protein/permease [Alphaproteobacteria bacterium]
MPKSKIIPETFPLSCTLVKNPKTLLGFMMQNFWYFFGWVFVFRTICINTASVGYRLFPPIALGMVTALLAGGGTDYFMMELGKIVITIVAVFLVCDVLWTAQNILWGRTRPRSRVRILQNLLSYVHCQSSAFINKRMAGKISQQVNNIASRCVELMNLMFSRLVRLGFVMLAGVGMIFVFHWSIAVIIAVALFINFSWFALNLKRVALASARRASTVSHMTGTVTDSIGGAANVRAFSGRLRELSFMQRIFKLYYQRFNLAIYASRRSWVPILFFNTFITGAVIFMAASLFKSDVISAAAVMTIITAYLAMDAAMWDFMDVFSEFISDKAEVSRNYKELNTRIAIADKSGAMPLECAGAAVDFDAVDFKYDRGAPAVLKKFNLSVKAGEHVGIVGASGSGKTTIIKLLMRMYDINSGAIKIDGQEIDKVSLESLRKNIAFIPQDTSLFNRSILDNLKYANPSATMDDVIRAAKFAEAHDFISKMSNGYHTMVGDRGVKLSGGQRQRIAIARAFLQHAPILLIDEATSALDSDTEKLIQDAVAKIAENKTMLVVAHRLSTLAALDRIIVLKNGKIAEQGTHTQLIKKSNGIYARKFKRQSCGFLG